MHVISVKLFHAAARRYPNQGIAIMDTYRVLRKATFTSPHAMRSVFPLLDNFKHKDKWWVINIGGNHLRLIAFIQFIHNRMYAKHILNHAEYDKLCHQYQQGIKK